jgi:TolB-like protein
VTEIHRFDRFELRPSERLLLADGAPVGLGSRAFDLLLCLIAHRERVLTKGELLQQVWPGQVVEENNLSVHVRALRKVLGDDAIATVSGRGYQFTLPLARIDTPHAAMAAPLSIERLTVAVLPFSTLSEDGRIVYFAQGLVEDVIALLSRVPGFFVIANASSSQFRGQQATSHQVSRQLGVRYLVQGSVRPRNGSLRVSLQLLEAVSGQILWTAQFDSSAGDSTDAQEQIARGIISQLEPELTRAQIDYIRRQRPENLDAWAHYHEAIGAIASRGWSAEAMAAARDSLRRSFALDPSFGLAHAHYALLTILAAGIGMVPDTPGLRDEVLSAAERAIGFDAGSSEVLGYAGCALCELGRFEQGIDILHQALELDPSNAQAHVALGAALALNHEFAEGIERMRHGMKLSPRDRRLGFWRWALGGFLLRTDRLDEALVEARLSCRVDPRFHLAYVLLAVILDRQGFGDEAVAALREARQRREQLSLDEIQRAHGQRIAERLAPLWERSDRSSGSGFQALA